MVENAQPIEPELSSGVALGKITRGSRNYLQARWALFAAGFTTFAMLYCVQPLMPVFSSYFAISPTASSLSVSVATLMLAVSMPIAGAISESFGRKGPMAISLFAAAALCMIAALAPSWNALLVTRVFEGIALASVPTVAVAYLSEEIEPRDLGSAIGTYIGGTALGGMLGRVLTGVLVEVTGSWRVSLAIMAALAFAAAAVFVRTLPPSRHFPRAHGIDFVRLAAAFRRHLQDSVIRALCLEGFLLMGGFVTVFNYISYRLAAAPYHLSQSVMGAIFLVYLAGIPASPWFGAWGSRVGNGRAVSGAVLLMLIGLGVTLLSSLAGIIIGLTLFSAGFFGGHTILSGWVGARADGGKAQASALYLLAYYLGSSIVGSFGGRVWETLGWTGVAGFVALLISVALIVAWRLRRVAT